MFFINFILTPFHSRFAEKINKEVFTYLLQEKTIWWNLASMTFEANVNDSVSNLKKKKHTLS